MLFGVHLRLLMGKDNAVPVSSKIIQSLQSVEVRNSIEERNVADLIFGAGKGGTDNPLDYSIINDEVFDAFNRIQIVVYFGFTPQVLFDGIITVKQFLTNDEPGKTTFQIKVEDVGYMMDKLDTSVSYPETSVSDIVKKILDSYSMFISWPDVHKPSNESTNSKSDVVRLQNETDLKYIQREAYNNGFVFYIEPTDTPGKSKAYWGPSDKFEKLDEPLSVNMGSDSNVSQMKFQNNMIEPVIMNGYVMDRDTNQILPAWSDPSTRVPMATQRSWQDDIQNTRIKQLVANGGSTVPEAKNQAQAAHESSINYAVTATGDLDLAKYGNLLRVGRKVRVRGAGKQNNGDYNVTKVTTKIIPGSIVQNFELSREGTGSTMRNAL